MSKNNKQTNQNTSFSGNHALYLAAGYQNDLDALRHALVDNKLLQTKPFGKGYTIINEKLPYNVSYQPDWRPYANKTVDSFTAAHQAASRGFKTSLEFLFEYHWLSNADDGRGKTPADYAFENGHEELSEWIQERTRFQKESRKIDKYLRTSLTKGDVTLQEFLIRIGYIIKRPSGKLILGNTEKAIKFLWTTLMQRKAKDLSIKENDFNKILTKISMEVDGLELDLPLNAAELRKSRTPMRKHVELE